MRLLAHYFAGSPSEDALQLIDYAPIIIIFPCLVERSLHSVGEFVPSWTAPAYLDHFCIDGRLALVYAVFLKDL